MPSAVSPCSVGSITSRTMRWCRPALTTGAGEYAPMPPVLGPRSPSSRRLWSWEVASGSMCAPSAMTMKLASSPVRNSSITTSLPAAPNCPANMPAALAIAASMVSAITTPLPAASPLALTTSGVCWLRTQAGSKVAWVKVRERAVGIRWRSRNSLAKALEPSSCAQRALGPKHFNPAAWKASTMPSTKGASGPTMVRSTRSRWARLTSAAMSSAATATLRTFGSAALPALPGATSTAATRAAAAHFHASACSRPPPPTISTFIAVAPASMAEMAHAGKDHRHVVRIGGGDDFGVTLAAARLDDGADAVAGGHVEVIAKRQERIRCHHRAGETQVFVGRLHRREARRVNAAHLPGADAECALLACEDDGVRFDELAHLPGEAQIDEFSGRRLTPAGHRQAVEIGQVARLRQQSAADAAELERSGGRCAQLAERQYPHVGLGGEHARGLRVHLRRRQHLDELPLGDRGRRGCVQLAVQGDDAAKCRGRVGAVGELVGGECVRAQGDAARVGVLDDHARGRGEGTHALDRRVGIGDVVE